MKMAGIDVHKKILMVVVIETTSPVEKPERRRFTTLPGDLSRLSSWLRAQEVQEAVMESTAQYWRTVWLELEPHMLLHLAHAFSNRAPRGRKHDFKDAERLVRRLFADELTRMPPVRMLPIEPPPASWLRMNPYVPSRNVELLI